MQIVLLVFSFHFQTSVTVRFVKLLSVDLHRIADRNDACQYPIDCLIDANGSSDVRLSLEYKAEAPQVLFLYTLTLGDQS